MRPRATASREVIALPETSTIRAAPFGIDVTEAAGPTPESRHPYLSRKFERSRAGARSPASALVRSASSTTSALARAWATRSADPIDRRGWATKRLAFEPELRGQVRTPAGPVRRGRGELGLDQGARDGGRSLEPQESGAHEEVERHLGRDRIAGQAEDQGVPVLAEDEGRPWLDRHLGEEEPHSVAEQRSLDEVEDSFRDSAGDDEHVVLQALANGGGDRGRGRPEPRRESAPPPPRGGPARGPPGHCCCGCGPGPEPARRPRARRR